jgi:hypothetical protein
VHRDTIVIGVNILLWFIIGEERKLSEASKVSWFSSVKIAPHYSSIAGINKQTFSNSSSLAPDTFKNNFINGAQKISGNRDMGAHR